MLYLMPPKKFIYVRRAGVGVELINEAILSKKKQIVLLTLTLNTAYKIFDYIIILANAFGIKHSDIAKRIIKFKDGKTINIFIHNEYIEFEKTNNHKDYLLGVINSF